jgi:hypothetical protein
MNPGDFLTRLFIWLALAAYPITIGLLLSSPGSPRIRTYARAVWTFGCASFLAHVLCAFAYFHHWSHAEAYRETARQTAALAGWNWGGGIYFNYAFAAAWLGDVLWWWFAPQSFAQRPAWITATWQGFFFFMFFNGAIVFGHGPVRILGILICIVLAVLWWRHRRERVGT